MENKKYQIFISSTYRDLVQARKKVSDVILKSYHFPVGMELFSAGDESQWEVITKIIDKTDYYILILGHRYGSLSPEGIGYTEMEYQYAKSLGIPVLSFIRSEDVATTKEERESDPELIMKLETFRKNAMANKMCDFWETEEDLESKILMALYKSFATIPRTGWVRGDQAINPEIATEIALLTKENRELKEQLEKINTVKRAPKIEVLFNDQNKIELEMEEFSKDRYPEKVFYEKIPEKLKKFTNKEEINEYNSLIDSNKEIKSYIEQINNYRNIQTNKKEFSICISNKGNLKANNIMIDISFPKEILILKKKEIKTLPVPKSLLPKHPLNKAKERFENENKKATGSTTQLISEFHQEKITPLTRPLRPILDYSMNDLIPFDPDRWIDIEEGKVTSKLSKLLHTRCTIFNGKNSFFLVPLKKGIFNIIVHIICEEMLEKKEVKIPVTVK